MRPETVQVLWSEEKIKEKKQERTNDQNQWPSHFYYDDDNGNDVEYDQEKKIKKCDSTVNLLKVHLINLEEKKKKKGSKWKKEQAIKMTSWK